MFFYQAVIMLAVIAIISLLAYVLKIKSRTVLSISIVTIILIGGVALFAIQNYFGVHLYPQKLDNTALSSLRISPAQAKELKSAFSDYSQSQGTQAGNTLSKTYHVNGNGANSTIDVAICVFSSKKEADNYFFMSQKFYENKTYLPADNENSDTGTSKDPRYILSMLKSNYDDFSDLIYLPSKIGYSSNLIWQNGSVIITMNEKANKEVTNKGTVLKDIESRLNNIK